MSGRPLDVLEESIGQQVTVRLKGGETHGGQLAGYDQHMNLVLDPLDEAANEDDDGTGGGDPVSPAETGVTGTESVADTTIIRGDNVVSLVL